MIEWDDKYSVGISIIDEQHKKLFGIINKTFYARENSDNAEELIEVLEEMTNYALEHFTTEEAYMIEFNYPEFESHNEKHYDFITRTSAYFNRVADGDYHISNELLEYLKHWLTDHIQVADREYINCFKMNGLK